MRTPKAEARRRKLDFSVLGFAVNKFVIKFFLCWSRRRVLAVNVEIFSLRRQRNLNFLQRILDCLFAQSACVVESCFCVVRAFKILPLQPAPSKTVHIGLKLIIIDPIIGGLIQAIEGSYCSEKTFPVSRCDSFVVGLQLNLFDVSRLIASFEPRQHDLRPILKDNGILAKHILSGGSSSDTLVRNRLNISHEMNEILFLFPDFANQGFVFPYLRLVILNTNALPVLLNVVDTIQQPLIKNIVFVNLGAI
mmetsp:Transcript_814/g.2343  ORF Transcript_814/g.2343 Transcript_814/m.2343 type:complete len:250 (-) Transcript_814:2308-3057(-)